MAYFIPLLFLFTFIYGSIKKVKPYDTFINGAKKSVPFIIKIFPNLLCIFIMVELFNESGLSTLFTNILSPVFTFFGIPKELSKLVLIKPFSGSGALGLLSDIFNTYGVDSYISRCACVIYGSSETVFYIASVYFCGIKDVKLFKPILISIVANFFAIIVGCFLCKIM